MTGYPVRVRNVRRNIGGKIRSTQQSNIITVTVFRCIMRNWGGGSAEQKHQRRIAKHCIWRERMRRVCSGHLAAGALEAWLTVITTFAPPNRLLASISDISWRSALYENGALLVSNACCSPATAFRPFLWRWYKLMSSVLFADITASGHRSSSWWALVSQFLSTARRLSATSPDGWQLSWNQSRIPHVYSLQHDIVCALSVYRCTPSFVSQFAGNC